MLRRESGGSALSRIHIGEDMVVEYRGGTEDEVMLRVEERVGNTIGGRDVRVPLHQSVPVGRDVCIEYEKPSTLNGRPGVSLGVTAPRSVDILRGEIYRGPALGEAAVTTGYLVGEAPRYVTRDGTVEAVIVSVETFEALRERSERLREIEGGRRVDNHPDRAVGSTPHRAPAKGAPR